MAINKNHLLLALILCGSIFLLFANINNQYLWQDEAETALVSKTILTGGLPRGYDGKNYFSQLEGADCGLSYVWRYHSWLPFYVLAGCYKIFGIDTFTSRLPFLLFGFGTVVLVYFFSNKLWSNTRIAFLAVILLSISVPFLLLCRQSRYYSMAMFFTILSLYAYRLFLERKKYGGIMIIAVSTLLFHSQYIYIGIFFATILFHSFIFYREQFKGLLLVVLITAFMQIPWLLWWIKGLSHPNEKLFETSFLTTIKVIYLYLNQINDYVFPLWMLIVLVLVIILKKVNIQNYISRKSVLTEKISLLILFIVFNIIFISAATPDWYFRYIGPSLPLLIILLAVFINYFYSVHRLAGIAAVLLLIATGQMKDYLHEITHDYDGPIEGIVKYLNEHADSNDIAVITFGDLPLKFYTRLKIVGGSTGEDLSPAKEAHWIILRARINNKRVFDYLTENIDQSEYREIEIDYPDVIWQNREDPAYHHFRTPKSPNKVRILEKIR